MAAMIITTMLNMEMITAINKMVTVLINLNSRNNGITVNIMTRISIATEIAADTTLIMEIATAIIKTVMRRTEIMKLLSLQIIEK